MKHSTVVKGLKQIIDSKEEENERLRTFIHSLLLIAGFLAIFFCLGWAAFGFTYYQLQQIK